MVLDIRRHVFMMRKILCQTGILWVFPGIIPVDLLLTVPHFVRVGHDALQRKIQTLKHPQHNASAKLDSTFKDPDSRATWIDANRVLAHRRL